MTHPGEVLSQERLLEHVWDKNADPFTNTVRVTVGTLRRKLSVDDEAPLLETVIGSGYRLRGGRRRRSAAVRAPPPCRPVRPRRPCRSHGPLAAGLPGPEPPAGRSVRVRLSLLYSAVVFGLGAILVALVYIGLVRVAAERSP